MMAQMTKRALAASLKNILLKKPLAQVSIHDITDDCGVSRMTFYYHFSDIHDLIQWIFAQEAAAALSGGQAGAWQDGLLNIFRVVQNNRPFVVNLFHSVGREQMETYLYHLTHDFILGIVEETGVGMTIQEPDKEFIADFYKYALVGVLLNWIKNDMKEDPAEIAARLSVLMGGALPRALNELRTDGLCPQEPVE